MSFNRYAEAAQARPSKPVTPPKKNDEELPAYQRPTVYVCEEGEAAAMRISPTRTTRPSIDVLQKKYNTVL